MGKKRILLYTAKLPFSKNDVDGGSLLTKQLIDTFKNIATLDVNFVRDTSENFSNEEINSVKFFRHEKAFEDKFKNYLDLKNINQIALSDFDNYDKILIVHTSKLFGINNNEIFKKCVLFPMFCTSSYRRSNNIVPEEYFKEEKEVINNVEKIITPSEVEKEDLIKDYGCLKEKIYVVSRSVDPCFSHCQHMISETRINLITIGSIKAQKNYFDQIQIIKTLINKGYKANLHIVCTVQNKDVYNNLLKLIDENCLNKFIFFHFALSQNEIATLCKSMDINISTSLWETFGRGIFEGISTGLPTIVYEKLRVVKDLCGNNGGVIYSADLKDFVSNIERLINDKKLYLIKQKETKKMSSIVSRLHEQEMLREIILG